MTKKPPLYIFDLDRTLANIEHRLHHIAKEPKNWDAFNRACTEDVPVDCVLQTLDSLRKGRGEIWIWTGRTIAVYQQTRDWLYKHKVFHPFWNPMTYPNSLRMRDIGDNQPDVSLKRGWLLDLPSEDWDRLTAVFEDRSEVVHMWREEGIQAYQVSDGDY